MREGRKEVLEEETLGYAVVSTIPGSNKKLGCMKVEAFGSRKTGVTIPPFYVVISVLL